MFVVADVFAPGVLASGLRVGVAGRPLVAEPEFVGRPRGEAEPSRAGGEADERDEPEAERLAGG